MIIDISELISMKVIEKEVNISYESKDLFDFDDSEIIEFSKPIDLNVKFTALGGIINLDGKLHTELKLACSRCLEKFNYPMDIEIHEKLSSDTNNKVEDVIAINGDKLDITEIVESNILISLPIKRLCKEDCKGLCQHCGTNLNYSTCKCEKDDIDLRLAKLKDLLADD